MKLRDIINTVGRDCVSFIVDENDQILDSEVEVIYFWYHHLNPEVDTNEIWDIIDRHDFKAFTEWREKLKNDPYDYLPLSATLFVKEQLVGNVMIAHNPEAFALITCQDYECG